MIKQYIWVNGAVRAGYSRQFRKWHFIHEKGLELAIHLPPGQGSALAKKVANLFAASISRNYKTTGNIALDGLGKHNIADLVKRTKVNNELD
jgi:hypothetical protein